MLRPRLPSLFEPGLLTLASGPGDDEQDTDSVNVRELLVLAVATSIDALAVGISFALIPNIPIAPANHFRYTYWPALAVTAALVLVLAAWRTRRPSPLRTP